MKGESKRVPFKCNACGSTVKIKRGKCWNHGIPRSHHNCKQLGNRTLRRIK